VQKQKKPGDDGVEIKSTQVPLFMQGDEVQSSMFFSQLVPLKPEQMQRY
jgi:hypothetical protein